MFALLNSINPFAAPMTNSPSAFEFTNFLLHSIQEAKKEIANLSQKYINIVEYIPTNLESFQLVLEQKIGNDSSDQSILALDEEFEIALLEDIEQLVNLRDTLRRLVAKAEGEKDRYFKQVNANKQDDNFGFEFGIDCPKYSGQVCEKPISFSSATKVKVTECYHAWNVSGDPLAEILKATKIALGIEEQPGKFPELITKSVSCFSNIMVKVSWIITQLISANEFTADASTNVNWSLFVSYLLGELTATSMAPLLAKDHYWGTIALELGKKAFAWFYNSASINVCSSTRLPQLDSSVKQYYLVPEQFPDNLSELVENSFKRFSGYRSNNNWSEAKLRSMRTAVLDEVIARLTHSEAEDHFIRHKFSCYHLLVCHLTSFHFQAATNHAAKCHLKGELLDTKVIQITVTLLSRAVNKIMNDTFYQ